MKPVKVALLIIFIALSFGASAQALSAIIPSITSGNAASKKTPKNLRSESERLIAQAQYENIGGAFEPNDTTLYYYSEGRYRSIFSGYAFDSLYELQYNQATSSYEKYLCAVETFDGNNNMLTEILYEWDTATLAYVNFIEGTFTYDANNNLLTFTIQQKHTVGGPFINSQKLIYGYDANNNQTSGVTQRWDDNYNIWVSVQNLMKSYNTSNMLTQQVYQAWDTLTGTWNNTANMLYTYNANNYVQDIATKRWSAIGNAWYDSLNVAYTYTANNLVDSVSGQAWNNVIANWVTLTRSLYTYDGNGNNTNTINKGYVTNRLADTSQYNYTYDANNNELSEITQSYNTITTLWTNTTRERYTYDSYNNPTIYITDTWHSGGFWQSTSTDVLNYYYYQLYYPSGIAPVEEANGKLNVYPSPSSTLLNIDLTWDHEQSATIAIYDASGRLYRQWQAPEGTSYQSNISVSELPTGTYYMSVKGNSGQITKSFSVVK